LNILTKISIVVLVVLVLAACVVFVRLATIAPNYKHWHQQERLSKIAARQQAAQSELALRRAVEERDKLREQTTRDKEAYDQRIAGLQTQVSQLQVQLAEEKNKVERMTANDRILAVALDKNVERRKQLASDLDGARTRINNLMDETRRLTEELKETQATNDRLQQTDKVHRENIAELLQQNKDLSEQLARRGAEPEGEESEAPIAATRITGKIKTVRNNLASINLGSAQGIKTGMKLYVYRGAQLVAYLRIEDVDLDESGGVIYDKQLEPQQNDSVTTSLQ